MYVNYNNPYHPFLPANPKKFSWPPEVREGLQALPAETSSRQKRMGHGASGPKNKVTNRRYWMILVAIGSYNLTKYIYIYNYNDYS